MNVNARGHMQMSDLPLTRPEECDHYVGTPERFISFAYHVLSDGRVVVHSTLCDLVEETCEDFLYEIAERPHAFDTAVTMVEDAIDYLVESGDRLDQNVTAQDFIDKLKQQLTVGLH